MSKRDETKTAGTPTPGPWRVDGFGPRPDVVSDRGLICETKHGPDDGMANARLIAAATQMREALAELLADLDTMNEPYRNEAICERARAALALADGSEPR